MDKAITGENVGLVLNGLKEARGLQKRLTARSSFRRRWMPARTFNKVALVYSRSGTLVQQEPARRMLNTNWFMPLEDAREKIERWMNDYNRLHPNSSLTYLTS